MHRRIVVAGGLAGAASLPAPNLAAAQPKLRWRCPGSFPKSVDTLWAVHERFCHRVGELTDGAFQITPFGPGEIVPALQVMDAVGGGNVECGFTPALFYFGKDPALAFGTAVPFGPSSRHMWSWLHTGGGREILREVYRDQGVHAIPTANTGAQMGGWFRREIRTPEDMKNLKFRIAGLAGMVMTKLGVVAQQLAPGDIYPSLERGVIDAAEYIGPYDDEKLGFSRIAKFYYYPGWWEYAPSTDLMVNAREWDRLPQQYRNAMEAAGAECWHWVMARYDELNPPAMRRLIAAGTQLRPYSREIMLAAYKASQELYAELGEQNPRFRKVWEHWDRHRLEQVQWFRVSEDPIANFVVLASAR
ncbi:TRAP transporter substrate-binding protein [Roseicella aquatilis]|uniref:ABC transporter substrate-binding protein n=1 Tax=Roseicella aquatilis TaxID=2527868 RepID=A0A4R4DID5_9PROT|nr:TRAP transporter substrate-binding protein DctP [Roseicella aquatilis]TCZ60875.1 ABC transporter substrate-binding protein [Roseicella aquatilis]